MIIITPTARNTGYCNIHIFRLRGNPHRHLSAALHFSTDSTASKPADFEWHISLQWEFYCGFTSAICGAFALSSACRTPRNKHPIKHLQHHPSLWTLLNIIYIYTNHSYFMEYFYILTRILVHVFILKHSPSIGIP